MATKIPTRTPTTRFNLSIDLETYSSVDLISYGAYRYAESPDFEILLFGYAFDGEDPVVVDFTSLSPTEMKAWKRRIAEWLTHGEYKLRAYNAEFEMACLSKFLGLEIPAEYWWDTQVTAATVGLPRSLADVGIALGLDSEYLKNPEGKALIRYFCQPCAPSKANGGRCRNRPSDAPDKWKRFVEYNRQDVIAERAIARKLARFEPSEAEHDAWILSVGINRRGVLCDRQMAENAVRISQEHTSLLMTELRQLTGLENPNSNVQLKEWLGLPDITKDTVTEALKTAEGDRKRVLELRRELGKTSIKKYEAMLGMMSPTDSRCRGVFSFYGANRTGRFTAKGIQLQNLPQSHIDMLKEARDLVCQGDRESLELLFGNVPDTLSQLIRTAFIAKPGHTFVVADFSAIEARVVAWLAGEKWRMDLFAAGGDIYCQSASKMFGVPVEKHGQNAELRQRGKVAELACLGYNTYVKTDCGFIPIIYVTPYMKLWDGEEWVSHGGVVWKGIRSCIEYAGLTATPDHQVFVNGEPVSFLYAAQHRLPIDGSKCQPDDLVVLDSPEPVYDILNVGPRNRFMTTAGLVHNCGYGGGVGAMINMGGEKLGLSEEELKRIVDLWREASPHIVDMWWDFDEKAKRCVKRGITSETVRGIVFSRSKRVLEIKLPSGRSLRYFDPHIGIGMFDKECIVYRGYEEGKWAESNTRGAKLVENCLVEGTRVVTSRGIIPIESIQDSDLIWDGEEWVHHGGLLDKGIQSSICVNGIGMTKDHPILTTEGWKACVEADQYYWREARLPGGCWQGTDEQFRRETDLACEMSELRECSTDAEETLRGESVLRMSEESADREGKNYSWDDEAPGVRGVAFNGSEVYRTHPSCLEELRGERNNCLRKMASFLRKLLGRHGIDVEKRSGDRQDKQRVRLFARKLSLGRTEVQHEEQTKNGLRGLSGSGKGTSCGACREIGDQSWNIVRSSEEQLANRVSLDRTERLKQVFDIKDCGQRNRFCVIDGQGIPRIVHNCTQAIARDCLVEAMKRVSKRYPGIVMHIHDEMVVEVPENKAEEALAYMTKCMADPIPWAPGLLLRGEGYESLFYRK